MSEHFSRVVGDVQLNTVTITGPTPSSPPFRLGTGGFDTTVCLGAFGIFRFDPMLSRIDPQGALRSAIVAALNADPHLADDIKHAAFAEPTPRS